MVYTELKSVNDVLVVLNKRIDNNNTYWNSNVIKIEILLNGVMIKFTRIETRDDTDNKNLHYIDFYDKDYMVCTLYIASGYTEWRYVSNDSRTTRMFLDIKTDWYKYKMDNMHGIE